MMLHLTCTRRMTLPGSESHFLMIIRLISGLFHPSIPIIVVIIFFLFLPQRTTWHVNPQDLFPFQYSRP